ncbi:hypothetical protein [Virgibacillus sp. Bac332]|uniref:hypothetical protein n=1 Tax=Virgibacillus sp. Bac332 TaxID=2419842 RepID=UPI000EF51A68|nr:hypothetical protein [Virgibacillus sp. Bac332]
MEFSDIKKGDKFLIAPNDYFMEILNLITEKDQLKGFSVRVHSPDNEVFIDELTQDKFKSIENHLFKLPEVKEG